VSYRKGAYASNPEDGRAASAIVDAFDSHIDRAVNGGMFNGDPRAINAWNAARAAHSDYRSTFTAGKNDPVGRVVEKIIGTKGNPAAIPNDVADFLYGSSGINPNSLNVAVAKRVKGILGDQSPEWAAVKQGLFSRIVETPPGVSDMGPGRIAQNVNKFLHGGGQELADALFNPVEKSLIRQYGELHRALEVPQAGAQWSNNLPWMKQILGKMSDGMTALLGAIIGNTLAPPGMHGIIEGAGAVIGGKVRGVLRQRSEAAQIAKQMPLVIDATQKFQKAMTAYVKSQSQPSQVAVSVSLSNLIRSASHVGINLAADAPTPDANQR